MTENPPDVATLGVISARDITKSFSGNLVLDNVRRDFQPGSITCVTGPSGCGKTTFLNILMGLEKPDAGTVSGVPRKIAAAFQDDRLLGSFTTLRNALITMDKSYTLGDAREHLEILGLSDSLSKPAKSLSGGMKKRLGLARALLSKPRALFLDEPFNGIDDDAKKIAARYVKRFAMGATIILVTHSREEMELMEAEMFALGRGGE